MSLLEIHKIVGMAYGLEFDDLTHDDTNAFKTQVCEQHAEELRAAGCEVYGDEHHHDTCGVTDCYDRNPVGIVYLYDTE